MNIGRLFRGACAVLLLSIVASNNVVGKGAMPRFDDFKSAGKASLSKLTSLFGSYVYQENIDREYSLENLSSLTVNNTEGAIKVKNGPHSNAIVLRANKRSNAQESLPNITVQEASIRKNGKSHLSLTTIYTGEKTHGAVDYTLEVPAHIALHLKTGNGQIYVEDIHGKVIAQTTRGNIDLQGTTGSVLAQTEQRGDITVENARGDIKTVTNHGNITVTNAAKSVIASCEKGTISTTMEKLGSTSLLELHSGTGNITVALPNDASARVQGHTTNGQFTSTHWIKVNSFTTLLNKKAWRQFRQGVEGTIGNGDAEVRLSSTHGNIKIVDTVAA